MQNCHMPDENMNSNETLETWSDNICFSTFLQTLTMDEFFSSLLFLLVNRLAINERKKIAMRSSGQVTRIW